jgi:hypothetical protein
MKDGFWILVYSTILFLTNNQPIRSACLDIYSISETKLAYGMDRKFLKGVWGANCILTMAVEIY